MGTPDFCGPSRLAAAASRRASLAALGSVVAALALNAPMSGEAKKGLKKNKPRKACTKQVAACRAQLRDFCAGDAACEAEILPCCAPLAACRAEETVECAFAYLEQ